MFTAFIFLFLFFSVICYLGQLNLKPSFLIVMIQKNKKPILKKWDGSSLVAGTGLEPVTFGL